MLCAAQDLSLQMVQPLLQTCFPHRRTAPDLMPLVADASTRRYFRLQWPGGADVLRTCILMCCEP